MKRLLTLLLSLTLLLFCGAQTAAAEASMQPISRAIATEALFLCRLTGHYSISVRLLAYAARDVGCVRFGETSVLSRRLAASEPLRTIAVQVSESGSSGQSGVVSFYGTGDLTYAVGLARYSMRIEETENGRVAVFSVSDRYDFNGIREEGTLSALLNNLGYRMQCKGLLHTYSWTATVVLEIDEYRD